MITEFKAFAPIARLFRDCVISEKIDGTNALIYVGDDGEIMAGSRSRWITPTNDHFGFARWVTDHAAELASLGPGYHYGEWWGAGIQRRYGLTEKRFSLFNIGRWGEGGTNADQRPACCGVVPLLYRGPFRLITVLDLANQLREEGSRAAPGFMNPEGLVVWHEAAQTLFKFTLDGDGHKTARTREPQGKATAVESTKPVAE